LRMEYYKGSIQILHFGLSRGYDILTVETTIPGLDASPSLIESNLQDATLLGP
jgi:hypothetical protein